MPRQSLHVEGLQETVRAFRRLPPDVKKRADPQIREIAQLVASETRSAARTPAEEKAATTIKAQKNSVSLGGGGRKDRAGLMSLGTEFGGRARPTTQQFRPHLGRTGYFFWPTIRANSARIKRMWDDVLTQALEDFSRGG